LLQITNGPNPDSGAIFRSNGDILLVTAISGGSGIYSVDSTGNNRQQIYDMADNEMWPEIFE
ncbi:MAG: hypothetical protein KDC26_12250, partial [Armatimonadetes bacterium]|nr:hypothetical protein [Armatimonadota bacterium]